MVISEVQIIPVKPASGLVAFASCVVDGQLFLGSLGIHKKLDGSGYRVTYPTKKIGNRQINIYHPLNKEAGIAIEEAICKACLQLLERSDELNGRHSKVTYSRD